jgi:hypothetical protein
MVSRELADEISWRAEFKPNLRKLKALGLTAQPRVG